MRSGLVLAVDWSGRRSGAAQTIWLAVVQDGRMTRLENGRSREEVVEAVIDLAGGRDDALVGFDFAFSFPRWYCEAMGWRRPEEVWSAMAEGGEALLDRCDPPFWGRAGRRRPDQAHLRRTEIEEAPGAKSVFQINGAGSVGTGSIRGMPLLRRLARAGFAIWPFDGPDGRPTVVEIYPRLFTGPVGKGRRHERRALLERRFGDQDGALLERAAGSEDAFDAAVSALEMARGERPLAAAADADHRLEGRIWLPGGPWTPPAASP